MSTESLYERAANAFLTRRALLAAACCGMVLGCGRRPPPPPAMKNAPPAPAAMSQAKNNLLPPVDLPQPSQRLGTAVVIVIDTSGSMLQEVRDHDNHKLPKHEIARKALTEIVQVTDAWQQKHKDSPLFLGINSFSSVTREVLPIGQFETKAATDAIGRIPQPGGGTAIGLALAEGFKSLYSTGCVRKHLVCITDGDNTVGTPPDLMARQLYSQTHGEVEMHFVAFDTSSRHFGFLKQTGGSVVEAADAKQLQARLTEIYEKRIFAEAMPAEKE